MWPHYPIVTDVTVWPITSDPNPSCSKIEKWKINQKENKMRNKINEVYFLSVWYYTWLNPDNISCMSVGYSIIIGI